MSNLRLKDHTWDAANVYDSSLGKTQAEINAEGGGTGEDGYSPVVTITDIAGGHRVNITDKTHQQGQSFDVMDGTNGAKGGKGDKGDKGDPGDPAPVEAITPTVSAWIAENLSQETGYVIDASLSTTGAAADAKATGDGIGRLEDAVLAEVPMEIVYGQGAIKSDDGTTSTTKRNYRIRSPFLTTEHGIKVVVPSGLRMMWFKYSTPASSGAGYEGYSGSWMQAGTYVLNEAPYYKIVLAYTGDNVPISPLEAQNVTVTRIEATDKTLTISGRAADAKIVGDILTDVKHNMEYPHDIPESAGVANVIRRAYQVTKAMFQTKKNIPGFSNRIIAAGATETGIPYSSVRPEMLYVPQCVSLETFMTAIQNPNSYLYTKRMNIPGYAGHTYYGSVCSAFVAWAYGIDDVVPTTVSFDTYPGFTELPAAQQKVEFLKLGDALNKSANHIRLVTDIYRNRFGDIVYVELSEETSDDLSRGRTVLREPQYITNMINNGYKIFRYSYIDSVPYEASPWVPIEDPHAEVPTYNQNIIPRRGDKANWHEGETVVIDVLDAESYTGWELRDIEAGTSTTGTLSGDSISFSSLTRGRYAVKLTGSGESSQEAYFDIVRTQGTSYEVLQNRQIKVTPAPGFTNNNGVVPSSVCFLINNTNNGTDHLAVMSFHVFDATDAANGYAIVDAPSNSGGVSTNDVWYMRCMYKTEFGLYAGDLTLVDVNDAGATATETAYTPSAYIENYG